jgi:hypothetical protein
VSRLFVLLFAVLLITSCEHPTAPASSAIDVDPAMAATVIHRPEVFDFDFTGLNPCTGEETQLTGQLKAQTTTVERPDGGFNLEFLVNGTATGIGLTTGAQYRAHQLEHGTFSTNGGEQSTQTYRFRLRVKTSGPQNDFFLVFGFHITINANGETTVLREPDTEECR